MTRIEIVRAHYVTELSEYWARVRVLEGPKDFSTYDFEDVATSTLWQMLGQVMMDPPNPDPSLIGTTNFAFKRIRGAAS